MISLNTIVNMPAALDVADLYELFTDYKIEIPPSGIMPSSAAGGGKKLVNFVVSDITHAELLDVLASSTPLLQDFGTQDLLPSPKPNYDPDDPQSEPTITVVHEPLNVSVWQFLPDRDIYDSGGNVIGSEQQTQLHSFQGSTAWPTR